MDKSDFPDNIGLGEQPNTKTKIFSVVVNENSTTFLYTLNRGKRKHFLRGKKFSCPLF